MVSTHNMFALDAFLIRWQDHQYHFSPLVIPPSQERDTVIEREP